MLSRLSQLVTPLGALWQQKYTGSIFRWNIIILVAQTAILVFKFNQLPPQVPLFYSLPWGVARLAPTPQLFIIPIYCLAVMVLNNFIAASVLAKSHLLSWLLIIFSLVISLLGLVTLVHITLLIT